MRKFYHLNTIAIHFSLKVFEGCAVVYNTTCLPHFPAKNTSRRTINRPRKNYIDSYTRTSFRDRESVLRSFAYTPLEEREERGSFFIHICVCGRRRNKGRRRIRSDGRGRGFACIQITLGERKEGKAQGKEGGRKPSLPFWLDRAGRQAA